MSQWPLIIAIVVVGVVTAAWRYLFTLRQLLGPLERLALENNGRVEKRFPLLPQLVLSRDNLDIRMGVGNSGLRGKDRLYTFVLFSGLDVGRVRWRLQTKLRKLEMDFGDFVAGHQTLVTTGLSEFDGLFVLTGSDPKWVAELFDPSILEMLLLWQQQSGHGLFDVHPYDDKLVFSVRGVVADHPKLHALLDLAETFCRHYRSRLEKVEALNS